MHNVIFSDRPSRSFESAAEALDYAEQEDAHVVVTDRDGEGVVSWSKASSEGRYGLLWDLASRERQEAGTDDLTVLVKRLESVADFLADDEDRADEEAALREAVVLLRTHAFPEEHPLAIL